MVLKQNVWVWESERGMERIRSEKSKIAKTINVFLIPTAGMRKGAIKKAPTPAPVRSSAYTHAPGLPLFQPAVRKPKRGKVAPQRIPSIRINTINIEVTTSFDFSLERKSDELQVIKHNNIMNRNITVNRTQHTYTL